MVGEVALDDPDLSAHLKLLRQNAADLEPGGLSAKLIIPNSQVLYTTLTAPSPDDASREEQIRAGLEGLTPYPVDELVFDWRIAKDGDRVHVAVVARETLDEAEGFAHDYRFNPVSLVARPSGAFKGEPFFGTTRIAVGLLDPGVEVEPDGRPVPVTPHPAPAAAPAPPEPEPAPAYEPEPAPEPEPVAEPRAFDTGADPDAALEALLAEVPDPVGVVYSTPKPARKPAPAPRKPRAQDPAPQAVLAPFPPTPEEEDDGDLMPEPPRPRVQREPPVREEPAPVDAPAMDAPEPKPEPEPIPAFTSRRTAPAAVPGPEQPPESHPPAQRRPVFGETREPPRDGHRDTPATRLDMAPDRTAPARPPAAASPAAEPAGERPTAAAAALSRGEGRRPGFAEIARRGLKGVTGAVASAGQGMATATARAAPVPAKAPALTPTPTPTRGPIRGFVSARPRAEQPKPEPKTSRRSEAEAMTVFGARRVQERGTPKYLGLVLTLILLLLMAVAAVWSMVFLSDETAVIDDAGPAGVTAPAGVEIGAVPLDDVPAATPQPQEPPADGERIAALPTALPPATPPVVAPPVTEVVPLPETPPVPLPPGEVISQEEAEAQYAVTGIWAKAPDPPRDPAGDRIDDLYIASIDPNITSTDAIALPPASAAAREPGLAAPLPPLPPGTEITLDERGLVSPTPEGTLTQDGILVFAGRPEIAAPVRPGREVQDPATVEMPDRRPTPRPGDLIEESERTELGGLTRTELAARRPEARPAIPGTVAEAVETTEPEVEAEAEAEIPRVDADDAVAAALVDANELAVARSPVPDHRPSDFAEIVARAREAADASDGSSVVAAAATTTPQIPTTASVATQATVPGAINLRNLNLIGIYGSSNARRALVRMPNGRYVKVAVGDQLDGGKVIAISESQLIYQKNGRNYSLDVLPLG